MLVCYNTNKHRTKPNRTELSIYSKIYIEQRKTNSRFSKREQREKEKRRKKQRNRDKFKNKSTIRRCVAVCCVCFFAPLLEKINTIIIIIRTVLLVSSGVRRRESTFEIQDSRFEVRFFCRVQPYMTYIPYILHVYYLGFKALYVLSAE